MYSRKYEQMFQHIYHRTLGKKPNIIMSKCFDTISIEFDGICAETFAHTFLVIVRYMYKNNVCKNISAPAII